MLNRIMLVWMSVLWSSAALQSQIVADNFSLSVTPTSQVIQLGKPILVSVVLTNISKSVLRIGEEKGRRGQLYDFRVTDSAGHSPCMTRDYAAKRTDDPCADANKPHIMLNSGSTFERSMKPNEAITDTVDLSRFFTFESAGSYSLTILRRDPQTGHIISSNTVTIELVSK